MYAVIFSLLLIPTPERIWTDPVENKQTKPVQIIQWNLPICVYKYIHTNTHTLNLKHWKIYWSSFKKYQHSGFRKGERYKICSFFHMYPTVAIQQQKKKQKNESLLWAISIDIFLKLFNVFCKSACSSFSGRRLSLYFISSTIAFCRQLRHFIWINCY